MGVAVGVQGDPAVADLRARSIAQSPLERMLRGEHQAMAEVIDAVAGEDSRRRGDWELLLGGLAEAMADMAVRKSVIDFPMGTAFWDAFTVEQCRHIVAALATMGFRYDGRDGWVEHHVPVLPRPVARARRHRRGPAPDPCLAECR